VVFSAAAAAAAAAAAGGWCVRLSDEIEAQHKYNLNADLPLLK
jgi:hypothetical protein